MTTPRFLERAEWRLTQHFFRAMFDFGILTQTGADSFKHMMLGAIGGLVAFGLLLTRVYLGKYADFSTAERYRRALLGDDMLLVGLSMLLVGFVTLLTSPALFPDERDFRILGPLPLRRIAVFRAKLTALLLFAGSFMLATHASLFPMILLTSMNRWREHAVPTRLAAWAVASTAASAFVVLAVTAAVGVLMLALTRSRFHALSATMRSVILAVLVLCVPLVLRLPAFGGALESGAAWLMLVPPAWFVAFQRVLAGSGDPLFVRLTWIALAAVGVTAAIVAVSYARLFSHFERLMLRSGAISPPRADMDRKTVLTPVSPEFRAVYQFTTASIRRSPLHQGVLVALSACGLGIAINSLVPLPRSLASAASWTPFAFMFACGLGARAALALPLEHRANWIFRMTENPATRRDQMRAVDMLATLFVVGVPVIAAFPLLWAALGTDAIVAAVVVALVGLVFAHVVLLEWRRIPFTCSYLPAKRFVGHTVVVGIVTCVLFTVVGAVLVRSATSGARPAVVIAAVLAVTAYLLRRHRLAMWSKTPLMFEDEFPDRPLELRL